MCAPRCMGALPLKAKRAPCCMGTHFCETVNRQTSQVDPPKNAQNHLKYTVLDFGRFVEPHRSGEVCAPRCMGVLRENAKRSATLHGNAFLFNTQPSINRQMSQVGPPENAKNRLKYSVWEVFWSLIGAERRARPKNGPAQVDVKELPRRSHKTLIF